MFAKEVYEERRNKLKSEIGEGIILLPGNGESGMNFRDNTYHFRQDSCFLYFTGISRPDLCLIIDIDNDQEILFGDELTVDDIVWTGALETIEAQAEKAGIAFTRKKTEVINALAGNRKVHFLPVYRAETSLKLMDWGLTGEASVPLIKAIVAQRSIKSEQEIQEIEKAITISTLMQLKAQEIARPGVTENAVAAQLQAVAIANGGQLSFPSILTVNGEILHNHASNTVLKDGQMVLCDCGAENELFYAGDLTRTFPVGKSFSSLQQDVYNIVLNAQLKAIEALQPGVLYKDVHLLASAHLVRGLIDLGLMKGDPEQAVAEGAHTLFFQCGLGHMMGLDVHDMENLGEEYIGYTAELKKSKEFGLKSLRLGKALEPGFVVTVEPGLYFIPVLIDSWAAENKHAQFINYEKVKQFRDFGGIRIEDDFLITTMGSRLLGPPLIKTVEDLHANR
ncbi:aminopeptidase P family protein [Pedobacter cryoconitis]|uniref:aminopeptidase P family protein n=1 Tax=Pedobacter cryoconitis TaxID=188932 RepID=UPI0016218369|nr:aminopeptidase P family protein [Pedobacter cryoconitis]MBB5648133.1 Xaa-Pro aminopeptidase [Pedobacter cryoconitis]